MKTQSVSQLLISKANRRIEIAGSRFRFGRSPHCDFRSDDPAVSRQHAEFIVAGDRLIVHDLDSSNGTKVNGRRVTERALNPGDVITLANQEFRYEVEVHHQAALFPRLLSRLRGLFGKSQPPIVTQLAMRREPREAEFTEPMMCTLGKMREVPAERDQPPAPLQVNDYTNSIPRRNLSASGSVDL